VDTALVAGMTLAGLVVGGVLDPVGQRLAEHSRALDEQRRAALAEEQAAERAAKRAARHPEGEDLDDPDPEVALSDGEEETRDPLGSEADDPVEVPTGAPHLLPQGRSAGRTIAAAILTGGLFAALAVHFGSHLVLAPFAVFVATAVAVSFTDLSFRLVPRWLIYGAVALIVPLLVVTAAVEHQWQHLSGVAIGGAAAFALFFAIWWFIPKGMGYGDVRLAGLIGITTGYLSLLHTYLAFLGGFLLGAVFGVALMVGGSSGRKTRIPFAPSLAVGAVLAIFYGAHVAQSLFGATP
jgi:prepilin signal peptidase PulO-like enzyme (type II secretory pathway)